MAIYEISSDKFRKIDETTFSTAGLRERDDLQRLLRTQIEIIVPDTLVIAEEFSQWEDSRRRIDLLGIDKNANLVVIELKRTEDGGHMELQALRYAAMISAMTFERAVQVYSDFLESINSKEDANSSLLEFLGWDEPDEELFAQDVRITLVSADFSKELTTSVLWLNEQDLDIECVRIKPYSDNGRILADIQQIIPLPETEDFQIQIKEKQRRERETRKSKSDLTRYDLKLGDEVCRDLAKRNTIFKIVRFLFDRGHSLEELIEAFSARKASVFRKVKGTLDSEEVFLTKIKQKCKKEGFAFDDRRYFTKDDELFQHNGFTYSFFKEWGREFLVPVECLLKSFPDDGIEYCESSKNQRF